MSKKDAGLSSRYREKAGPKCFPVTDDRDREHFGGGTVSKTIERAGHMDSNQCPVSRALWSSIGFPSAFFEPLGRVAATTIWYFEHFASRKLLPLCNCEMPSVHRLR